MASPPMTEWLALAAASVTSNLSAEAPLPPPARQTAIRPWTAEDIATIPETSNVLLTTDGRAALYVIRSADLQSNKKLSALHLVDLANQTDRTLFNANWIDKLKRIPGSADWSALLDLGDGVQLYRIDAEGRTTPIATNDQTALEGSADQAIFSHRPEAPLRVGILSYDWSPDGKALWYSRYRPISMASRILFDDALPTSGYLLRSHPAVEIEYRIRYREGADLKVAIRPVSDRIAHFFGGNPRWTASGLDYATEAFSPEGASIFTSYRWDLGARQNRTLPGPPTSPYWSEPIGPHGGRLAISGFGGDRQLIETMPNGSVHRFGGTDYSIGDPRSAGHWRSTDGTLAIVGTRRDRDPGYGLIAIGKHGVQRLPIPGSVTACDFTPDLQTGVCLHEGIATPPELVLVKPLQGTIRRLVGISPRHEAITPLRAEPRIWTNRLGYYTNGFLVYPRGFKQGLRYPTILVTHSSDADGKFGNIDLQWNYPVQLFAERGYLVVLMNDPPAGQDARLRAASDQWASGAGSLPPIEMQRRMWLNGVYSFEDGINDLVREGLVDPTRVGIAGYSRGSQMVNVAMTQSSLFRVASSGDGGFLEPSAYMGSKRSYDAIYGGSPFGPHLEDYRRFAPSLRASHASGPILQQMAAPLSGTIELYRALKEAGVPTQITLYPGENSASDETHIFHIPSNRLAAMRENIAWFDFWLRGRKYDPLFSDRYRLWTTMAADAHP